VPPQRGARWRRHIGEVAMMGAIVTTLLFVPAAALLAGLLFLFGISLYAVLTFGGALNAVQGLLAWWTLGFLPAAAYAGYVLPWHGREL
jgi:hypothetical protein